MKSNEGSLKKSGNNMKWLDRLLRADDRQQKLLEAFFKEYKTWNWGDLGLKFAGWFCIGCSMIFQVIPWQSWDFETFSFDKFTIFVTVYLKMIGIDTIMRGYKDFTENPGGRKRKRFGEILKCVPVSVHQLSVFRLKRAIPFCFKLSVITLAFQVIGALIVYHGITAGNILFPLVGTFMIPIAGVIITESTQRFR